VTAMGRTNPTYRDLVRATERRWGDFRRALRRSDRPQFDRLFEHARAHADAAGYCNHATPEVPILVSVALEHEKAIEEQRAAAADRERRLAALEARLEAVDGREGSDSRG